MKTVELIMVSGENNNKFYRMTDTEDGNFKVEYGRIGLTSVTETYPMSRWNSKYKEKLKKGYKDVTDLKIETQSGDYLFSSTDIEHFYRTFSKYTKDNVSRNYTIAVGAVTKVMLDEAQQVLNELVKYPNADDFNKFLLNLYTVLPRRMSNVKDYLIKGDEEQDKLDKLIAKEQDVLDSLSSSVITNVTSADEKFEDSLGIEISLLTDVNELNQIENLINPTNSSGRNIYRVYKVENKIRTEKFHKWVNSQEFDYSKRVELLIHGTRNPNIFNILKSGLLIRPTNAVCISGAAYNQGLYHSLHTAKSMNYTGNDPDKIFFLQSVCVGKWYEYSGWYRDGKDISRSQMTYSGLKSLGYDSLYVKPGDGLMNSEIITYTEDQSNTSYLVWMK